VSVRFYWSCHIEKKKKGASHLTCTLKGTRRRDALHIIEMAKNEVIEYGNETPSSEVGSYSQPISADEQFRALLEQQNRNFLELAKSLRATTKESQQNGVTKLPKFNADVAGADATQLCATVDIVLSEKPLHGSALVLALSESLEGSASLWLSQICFPGITWEQQLLCRGSKARRRRQLPC